MTRPRRLVEPKGGATIAAKAHEEQRERNLSLQVARQRAEARARDTQVHVDWPSMQFKDDTEPARRLRELLERPIP